MATGSGSMRIWPRWAAMVRARPMLRSPWAWRPGYRVSFSTSAQLGEAREERALERSERRLDRFAQSTHI